MIFPDTEVRLPSLLFSVLFSSLSKNRSVVSFFFFQALETSPDHYDSSNMMEKCLATSPLRTLDPCHQVLYTCGYSASSSVLKLAFH